MEKAKRPPRTIKQFFGIMIYEWFYISFNLGVYLFSLFARFYFALMVSAVFVSSGTFMISETINTPMTNEQWQGMLAVGLMIILIGVYLGIRIINWQVFKFEVDHVLEGLDKIHDGKPRLLRKIFKDLKPNYGRVIPFDELETDDYSHLTDDFETEKRLETENKAITESRIRF